MDEEDLKALPSLLVKAGLCGCLQEAEAVLDSRTDDDQSLEAYLQEYFGSEAIDLLKRLRSKAFDAVESEEIDVDEQVPADSEETLEGLELDDEEELIGPGECELCERYMKLTRHHLIPKSTWNRVESRFYKDDEFEEIRVQFDAVDVPLKMFLSHYTTDLCRKCHSHIHSTFTNWELAVSYNSLDKLLGDERIYKFASWAHKQRTGKQTR